MELVKDGQIVLDGTINKSEKEKIVFELFESYQRLFALARLTNEELNEELKRHLENYDNMVGHYGDDVAYKDKYIVPIYIEKENRGHYKFYKNYAGITRCRIDEEYYYEYKNYKKSQRLEDLIDYYGNDNELYETLDEALENLDEVYAYSWGIVYGKDKLIKVGKYYKQYGRVWVL